MGKTYVTITSKKALELFLEQGIQVLGINRKIDHGGIADARLIGKIPIGEIQSGEWMFIRSVEETDLYEKLMKKYDEALYNRMYGIRGTINSNSSDSSDEESDSNEKHSKTSTKTKKSAELVNDKNGRPKFEMVEKPVLKDEEAEEIKEEHKVNDKDSNYNKGVLSSKDELSTEYLDIIEKLKEMELKRKENGGRARVSKEMREMIYYLKIKGVTLKLISDLTGIKYQTVFMSASKIKSK